MKLYCVKNLAIYLTFQLVSHQNPQPSYLRSHFFLMGIIHAYVVRILYFRASLLSQINILLWSQLVEEFYLFFLRKRKEKSIL